MARYKITTEDGKSYAITTEDPPQGFLDKAKAAVSTALSIPGATDNPFSLPAKGYNVINELASRAGEKVATSLAQSGIRPPFARESIPVGPKTAAAIGTGVAMAPDIVSSVAGPIMETPVAPKSVALGPARRALGYSKRFLQTPFARRQATSAANVALQEGVIPGFGNPEVMMERAQNLRMKTGSELGAIRGSAGSQPIDKVLYDLADLKQELTQGATTGIQGKKLAQIQMAEDTLKNLVQKGGRVSLNEVIKAKNDLGETINWLADNATQKTHKAIVNSIESSVKDILGGTGADLGRYNYLKKIYGASKSMIKALNNELSSQKGNMAMSLPTHMIAAGEMATGHPIRALETAGLWELLKRRGAGITASSLNKARIPMGAVNSLLQYRQKQ